MKPQDFFDKYGNDAHEAMVQKGIPASVTLAQAAIESAWGQAVYQNNFFGIKADKDWRGNKQLLMTTEVLKQSNEDMLVLARGGFKFPEVISITPRPDGMFLWKVRDYFRAYDSPRDGFIDHANFFIVNSRYHQAILDKDNAEKFAMDIAEAHYATAPNYGQTIINVIHEYNLTKYDSKL